MRVHAIRTGTVAIRERQRRGRGRGRARLLHTLLDSNWTEPLPILAWAIEHPEGTIVVDTGETARAGEPGYAPRWNPYYRFGLEEAVEPAEEIGPQLEGLGIDPREVRRVVMTHLHTDHAGGLEHFPQSEIVVARRELELASGPMGKLRGYLPHRWPSWFEPTAIELEQRAFGPFEWSRVLTDAGDVLMVPTPGHTLGHVSVVVLSDEGLVFLAGDASYTEELMLEGVADGITAEPEIALETLERIRELTRREPTVYLPSHDPESVARLRQAQAVPARQEAATLGAPR